jgi:hypothetical protein
MLCLHLAPLSRRPCLGAVLVARNHALSQLASKLASSSSTHVAEARWATSFISSTSLLSSRSVTLLALPRKLLGVADEEGMSRDQQAAPHDEKHRVCSVFVATPVSNSLTGERSSDVWAMLFKGEVCREQSTSF